MKSIASFAKFAVPALALLLAGCGGGPRTIAEPSFSPPQPSARPAWQKPSPPAHTAAPVAPAGPLTVARIGSYMDGLESELRRHVHGEGITVARMGDDITVILRNDKLFSRDGNLDADDVLEPLGAVLGSYVHTSVAVSGYTDTVGAPDQNLALSQKRAGAFAGALAHEGVSPQRITAQGYGETHLRIATGDDKKEPRNRRIEVLIRARPG
jgi:outer membrane protein OmpA-like peptidoglycan-associated protein